MQINKEFCLFICYWMQISWKESYGYIHFAMMPVQRGSSFWCTLIWGSIQPSFSTHIVWAYINSTIFYICWDPWLRKNSPIRGWGGLSKMSKMSKKSVIELSQLGQDLFDFSDLTSGHPLTHPLTHPSTHRYLQTKSNYIDKFKLY